MIKPNSASSESLSVNLLLKQFEPELTLAIGDPQTLFSTLRPYEDDAENALVVAPTAKDLIQALAKRNRVIITHPKAYASIDPGLVHIRTVLLHARPTLIMAQIATRYFEPNKIPNGKATIHPSAAIDPTAKVSPLAHIEANVVIKERVCIGANSRIGANSVLEKDVSIGDDTNIHPLVYIGPRTKIGSNCEIKSQTAIGTAGYGFVTDENGKHHAIPQMGRVVIEDRVSIGAGCTIDRATFDETRVGAGTKFDNLVHIAHNVRIGQDCLLTAGLIIAGSSSIGDRVVTGGRVSITDHIQVTNDVQLAGLSGVSNDIDKSGAYGGYPLQPVKDALRMTANLVHLTEMRRTLARVVKHLNLKRDE